MSEDFDQRRNELHELNLRSWNGEQVYSLKLKLDTSLKKNTTFIKKIRTSLTWSQCPSILKDIETVSLEKYLAEIILSLCVGLVKVNKSDDIAAAVEIVSALHQRFTTAFTPIFALRIIQTLSNLNQGDFLSKEEIEKEDARIIRQKNLLRLFSEFYICGIIRSFDDCYIEGLPSHVTKILNKCPDEDVLLYVIKAILNHDLELGNNLSLVQAFLKRFAHLINSESDLLGAEVSKKLRKIFLIYSKRVFETLKTLNMKLLKLHEQDKKASIRTGRLLEENRSDIDEVSALFEKFKTVADQLAVTFNLELPNLEGPDLRIDAPSSDVIVDKEAIDEWKVWESAKVKRFYTCFPVFKPVEQENSDLAQPNNTDGEKINEFLQRLETFESEDDVDKLSEEYRRLSLNNKATRNRLMRHFIETQNIANLRYYGRFLKVNEQILLPLIEDLVNYIDRGVRSQLHGSSLNFKNIFFFCELIKFKLVPVHIIFHKFRRLTLDITFTNNIDILSILYENCGRFLLQEMEYRELMVEMIDLLKQKQKGDNLSANDKLAINNLLNIVFPSNTKVDQLQQEENLSPLQKFVTTLIRDLSSESFPVITKLLKKIYTDEDPGLLSILVDSFSAPDRIGYDNIIFLAKLLSQLSQSSPKLLYMVIDTLFENIIRDLELNDSRQNRRRLAHVRLVSELYNVQLINLKCVLKIGYKILCLGHPNNQPLISNYEVTIDLPDDYFRLRLICLLFKNLSLNKELMLKNSGKRVHRSFEKVLENKKRSLRSFFLFLQFYCFTKQRPLHMEIRFQMEDLLNKYISMGITQKYATLRDVLAALQELDKESRSSLDVASMDAEYEATEEIQDDDEATSYNNDSENEDMNEGDNNSIVSSDAETNSDSLLSGDDNETIEGTPFEEDQIDESEDYESTDDPDAGDDSYEESDVDTSSETESDNESERLITSEEELKFSEQLDRDFQKLVLDSYAQNMSQRSDRGKLNIPLPHRNPLQTNTKEKVSFSLLTKSGKKSDVKDVHLDANTALATSILKEKENQKKQRERIISLVLNMDN